jgi:hypothetical protein
LACNDRALERVTTIERTVKPIWMPTSVLERWFLGEEGFVAHAKSERTKSSSTKYKIPTTTIKAPPTMLQ